MADTTPAGVQVTDTNTKNVEGMVNIKGQKMVMSNNSEVGGWSCASRIIFLGGVESFIFYGIASNLMSFLTMQLGQSTATAAQNVNGWTGFMHSLPLLAVFVLGLPSLVLGLPSYFNRYLTILISGVFYLLGLLAITLYDFVMDGWSYNGKVIFFFSLYLIGIGSVGFKTCAPAFGADQFDDRNPNDSKSKISFFKWWLFGLSVGSCSSHLIFNYVQDNLGWYITFGTSTILMNIALIVIIFGGVCYRSAHRKDADKVNPLEALTNGLVAAVKNFKVEDVSVEPPLVPGWMVWLTYPLVHSQVLTFFVKQGSTMERSIALDFQVPAASIQIFLTVSIILFAATYDRIFAPLARAITGKSNAITSLQKIGGGIFVSAITMVVAGLVENKRLKVAQEFGLVNDPNTIVPMVIWWLIPQYILSGLALVLTKVGLQEFYNDQVIPNDLRSLGLSLYSSIFGMGDIFSVFVVSVIQMVTSTADGQDGWLANNMNQGHLDYFYWFLAGLSAIELAAFLCFAKSYEYNNQGNAPM